MNQYWPVSVLVVVLLGRFLGGNLLPADLLPCTFYDDAFYYFAIAENIIEGAGVTFDGLARTNGFQPLWMVLLLPFVFLLRPDSAGAGIILYSLIGIGCYLWLAILLFRLVRNWFGKWAAAMGVLLLAVSKPTRLFSAGMESTILGIGVLWLIASAERILSEREKDEKVYARRWWSLALAAAAVSLSRVDHALVAAIVLAFVLIYDWLKQSRPAETIRNAVILAVPTVISLSVYFGINHFYFGHWKPVSGAIKTAADLPIRPEMWLADRSLILLAASNLLVLVILLIRWYVKREYRGISFVLIAWATANAAYTIFLFSAVRWVLPHWYFVSSVLLLIVALSRLGAWAMDQIIGDSRVIRTGLLILLALGAVFTQYRSFQAVAAPDGIQVSTLRAADWTNENFPPDAVIAMADAGLFAYHVDHRVINIDGVVNGWEFFHACREGRSVDYLRKQGVTHLVTVFGKGLKYSSGIEVSYRVPCPVGGAEGNTFRFKRSDIIYRQEYHFPPDPEGTQRIIAVKLN